MKTKQIRIELNDLCWKLKVSESLTLTECLENLRVGAQILLHENESLKREVTYLQKMVEDLEKCKDLNLEDEDGEGCGGQL